MSMSMHITIIPTREDNYSYLLESNGKTAIVDAGEAAPIIKTLDEKGLELDTLLLTHHHYDHIDAAPALKKRYPNMKIIAAKADAHRIPNIDTELSDGDTYTFGNEEIQIIDTPGHTIGHICYYAPGSKALFCADTLFSLGCGRLFEGSAEQMWHSLEKLKALPDDTRIYPGHEYTQSNGEFALTQSPDNPALIARMEEIAEQRAQNHPTIPTTLAQEKATNPFLQTKTAEQFAQLRSLKDTS